jgi:hypothetical protein
MSYYSGPYMKRLNRYGEDYKTRILTQRQKAFSLYLLKSEYAVTFTYNNQEYTGSLEKYKQDETKILRYLLTDINLTIPNGTVLDIKDKDNKDVYWMVYYLNDIQNNGYNKHIMLRMTHSVTWLDSDKNSHSSYAYLYGQEDNMLKDEIRSRSRMDTIYDENLKSSFFIMPLNQYIKKDTYLEVGVAPYKESYRVTGFDIQSTPGVEYITIDPIYEYDNSAAPVKPTGDTSNDYFWLSGGES